MSTALSVVVLACFAYLLFVNIVAAVFLAVGAVGQCASVDDRDGVVEVRALRELGQRQ
mgnify:CR=1 FL=1